MVSGVDLREPAEVVALRGYLDKIRTQIVIMAPTCTPFGPLSYINSVHAPKAWRRSLEEAMPLARTCGAVAMYQPERDRDFFAEQPAGSWMYWIEPWPAVRRHPRTTRELLDQCQTGARSPSGRPIRKTSDLWASDGDLLAPFAGFRCENGTNQPEICVGNHEEMASSKVTD